MGKLCFFLVSIKKALFDVPAKERKLLEDLEVRGLFNGEKGDNFNKDVEALEKLNMQYVNTKNYLDILTKENKDFESSAGVKFTEPVNGCKQDVIKLKNEIKNREDNFYNIDFFSGK